jgi:DNA-binding transcriptional MerR regulator
MTYRGRRDVHTTLEVMAAAGVSYRSLRRWVVAGLLPQPQRHSRGRARGVVLLWPTSSMVLARRIAELTGRGYPLAEVKAKLAEPQRPNGRRRL